jgi:hypothetical protein
MVEILNVKNGTTIMKLNTTVINANAQGILISHCGKIRTRKIYHLTG